MTKKIEDIQKELDAPIPQEAVRERSNGSFNLAYLEGWYVIDRLNKVLGQFNWGYEVEKLDKVYEGQLENRYGKKEFHVSYVATVILTFNSLRSEDKYYSGHSFSDVGYGNGRDKMNPGAAHELATKEAVTDALKRCAKNLGMSMGLALYDKEQKHVGNEEEDTPVENTSKPVETTKTKSRKKEDLFKLIRAKAKVLEARDIISISEIKEKIKKDFKVSELADLTKPQSEELLTHLETLN